MNYDANATVNPKTPVGAFWKRYGWWLLLMFSIGAVLSIVGKTKEEAAWNDSVNNISSGATTQEFLRTQRDDKGIAGFWSIVSEIGSFLMASATVHFIYFAVLRRDELRELHEQIFGLRNAFRDDTKTAIGTIVRGIHEWGLVSVSGKMNYESLLTELKEGDELLWLDTLCPSLATFSDQLNDALVRKAKIKMLVLDPANEAAQWRRMELIGFYGGEKQFQDTFTLFLTILSDIRQRFPQHFEYRKYRDLIGIPCCILTRNDAPYKAVSGFYLNAPSDDTAHIEWSPGTADGGGMITSLRKYFVRKWERWPVSDVPNLGDGVWTYTTTSYDNAPFSASGTSDFEHTSGRGLRIEGIRLYENGQPRDPYLHWGRCSFAEICPDNVVRFDFDFDTDSPNPSPAVCRVKITAMDDDKYATEMKGEYFFLKADNKALPTQTYKTRSGTIVFERNRPDGKRTAEPKSTDGGSASSLRNV